MTEKTIKFSLPKASTLKKEGFVILPLKKWQELEERMEDLEMFASQKLAQEITKRRKEKETIS